MNSISPKINIQGGQNITAGAPSTIRVVRGGGAAIQARYDDREQFAALLGQLRLLEERAGVEMADYMQRNLRQVAQRLSEKSLAPAA